MFKDISLRDSHYIFIRFIIFLIFCSKTYADLPSSSTITAPDLIVSGIGIDGQQGNGNFYQPNTWVFVANDPLLSSRFRFSLNEAQGRKFSITNISFEHAEYLFNNNGGYPNFLLSISSPSLPTTLNYNIPYNLIVRLYDNPPMINFSQNMSTTYLDSANIAITIFNVGGGYGSPSVSIRNIQVQSSIVPEPSSLSLLLAGGAVLMVGRRRKSD